MCERFVFDEINFTYDPGYLGIQIGREYAWGVRIVKRRWLVFIISLAFFSFSMSNLRLVILCAAVAATLLISTQFEA